MLDGLLIPTAIVRDRDRMVLAANSAFADLLGLPIEAIIGKTQREIVTPVEDEARAAALTEFSETGRTEGREIVFITSAGVRREVVVYSKVMDGDGEPWIMMSLVDITARKRAERAAKASEEKFAHVFHAAIEPMWISRASDHLLLDVNESFARLVGRPMSEVLGKAAEATGLMVDPATRASLLEGLARDGSVRGAEATAVTKEGKRRDLLLSVTRVLVEGELRDVFSAVDVTDRKKAEDALRISEEKFSRVFHGSGSVLSIIRPKDFTIVDVNPAFSRIFGVAREDAIGKSMDQVSAPFGSGMDPARRAALRDRLAKGGELRDVAVTFNTKAGERRDLLVSVSGVTIAGEPLYLFTAIDVTEQAKLTASLRAADEMFARVFRSAALPMAITRMSDDVIIEVNDEFPALIGLGREEIVGKTGTEIGMTVDPSRRGAAMAALKRDGILRDEEVEVTLPDGRRRTMLLSAALITLGGAPCRFITMSDITSRKRMEDALRLANVDLDVFATTVAHDLRTPLRTVTQLAEVFLEDHRATLSPDAAKMMDLLSQEAHHASLLVRDLLSFSRLGLAPFARSNVDAEALARAVVEDAALDARKYGLRLRVSSMPPCMGDAGLLRLVFTNLVSNAIKFSRTVADQEIVIGWTPDEGGAYFVQDHGIGFDMAEAAELFTIFHRLPSAEGSEGTGLGLAVCRRIIERHGGRIWATSTPGKGATFFFTVPPPEDVGIPGA